MSYSFFQKSFFSILVCNLQTRRVMLIFVFLPPYQDEDLEDLDFHQVKYSIK